MNFEALKNFMDHLTEWRIPGNAISVYVNNQEVFSYQSGYMDVENKIKMNNQCLMNIYSTSKVTTAVAGMQLLEQGKFLLDTPLYDFIPEYREMYVNDVNGKIKRAENPITMRHLFTMTSGLNYVWQEDILKKVGEKTCGRFDTVEVAKAMAEKTLVFEPGSRWQYGISHDVLAAVVEVISGKKFRDYVRENIFEPLDMRETFYHRDADILKKMAPQYNFVNDDADKLSIVEEQASDLSKCGGHLERTDGKVSHIFGPEYDSGGAGIVTSVRDYAKLSNALANGGLGATGERILSSSAISLMKTPQVSADMLKNSGWSQLKGYGYGLGVRTMIDRAEGGALSSVGEFGWGGAAGSTVLVDTDKRLGLFYAHHMLNQQEAYYQPRLRNVVYSCLD